MQDLTKITALLSDTQVGGTLLQVVKVVQQYEMPDKEETGDDSNASSASSPSAAISPRGSVAAAGSSAQSPSVHNASRSVAEGSSAEARPSAAAGATAAEQSAVDDSVSDAGQTQMNATVSSIDMASDPYFGQPTVEDESGQLDDVRVDLVVPRPRPEY